jgi:hypothetical protein
VRDKIQPMDKNQPFFGSFWSVFIQSSRSHSFERVKTRNLVYMNPYS